MITLKKGDEGVYAVLEGSNFIGTIVKGGIQEQSLFTPTDNTTGLGAQAMGEICDWLDALNDDDSRDQI